jgi:hypothetical protein
MRCDRRRQARPVPSAPRPASTTRSTWT